MTHSSNHRQNFIWLINFSDVQTPGATQGHRAPFNKPHLNLFSRRADGGSSGAALFPLGGCGQDARRGVDLRVLGAAGSAAVALATCRQMVRTLLSCMHLAAASGKRDTLLKHVLLGQPVIGEDGECNSCSPDGEGRQGPPEKSREARTVRMGLRASGARLSRSPTRFRASGGRLSVKKSAFSSHGSFTNLRQGAQRQSCADGRCGKPGMVAFSSRGMECRQKVAKVELALMHFTPQNDLSTIRPLSDVTVQQTAQSATADRLLPLVMVHEA